MNLASASVFLRRFTVLNGAVRELWLVFLAKLLGVVAYSVMNTTFVLWLSYDLGYSDIRAGLVVTAWSTVMTLITVFVGSFTDAIGLRKALLLGLLVCVSSRAVLTLTTVKWLALAGGMLPLALGEALGVPVLVAGIRRYSTTAQRSISFAIFYAMMNGGFLIASLIFDRVRLRLGEPHGFLVLPIISARLTTYRTLFAVSFLFEFLLLIIVFLAFRDGVEATDEGVKITPAPRPSPRARFGSALWWMTCDALRQTGRIFAGLWRQAGFYKFLAFLGFAAFIRLIFTHMYYTYPKFGIRELGEGAPVGRLWTVVNSGLIIVLVPLVGAVSQRISAFNMLKVGSSIAAASVFIMAAPPRWFQPLADGWFGHQIANRWLGGYYRFVPDDFRDPAGLAARIEASTNAFVASIKADLSAATRALLRRELEPGSHASAAPSHPSSALFAPADLPDGTSLVARLKADLDPPTQPVSAFVVSQFSKSIRGAIGDEHSALHWVPGWALVPELNQVLHGEPIYRPDRFAGLPVSEAAHALFAEPAAGAVPALPNQTLLLNRLLLEDVYPSLIPRSHHPVRVALAHDFTRILGGASLCHRPGADALELSATARDLRARNPHGAALVRLNRLVLEDAFAAEDRAEPSRRSGERQSLLCHDRVVYHPVVRGRVNLLATALRVRGRHSAQGTGGDPTCRSLYLPFFLAKLLATSFSGVLLFRFCPESGPRHSGALWLIVALTTLVAPAGLLLFGRYIRVPEAGRDS